MADQIVPDSDPTEGIRRIHQFLIESGAIQPDDQTWTTDELARDFEVQGFMAPYVVVKRRSDGVLGSLAFSHSPRVYFGWKEDVK